MATTMTPFISEDLGTMFFDCYDYVNNKPRVQISVSATDAELIDKLPNYKSKKTAMITDELTGLKLLVKRASCGADCYCALKIIDVV